MELKNKELKLLEGIMGNSGVKNHLQVICLGFRLKFFWKKIVKISLMKKITDGV
jgi:hypothetical protein